MATDDLDAVRAEVRRQPGWHAHIRAIARDEIERWRRYLDKPAPAKAGAKDAKPKRKDRSHE